MINMDMKNKSKAFFITDGLLLILISFQLLMYIFIWRQLLTDPSLRTMDFVHFYGAGRLMREGNFSAIYDIDATRRVQREVVGSNEYEPLLYNHPPYLAPLLAMIADNDYVIAYQKWSLIRLMVWLLCLELIRRFLFAHQWNVRFSIYGALSCGLFFPIFLSFLGGQDTIFSLLGFLIWMFALLKRRDMEAGLGLAFATLTPTIAGVLFLPILISKRRVGIWFMVGGAVLFGYSLTMVGMDGMSKFLLLLKISSEGTYYGFVWTNMYNFVGLLLRLFPYFNTDQARLVIWIAVLFAIMLLSYLWQHKTISLTLIGFSMVIATFFSPHLYAHGLSFLLLPLLVAIVIFYEKGYLSLALLLIPTLSVAFMITEIVLPGSGYFLPYLLMGALSIGFAILLRSEVQTMQ